jgi:HD superfamily phosphodiesterase
MKYVHASLLALGLIFTIAAPAAAAETWRAKVTSFTAKLYGQVIDAHNQRDYAVAKELAAADHVTLDDDVIFAAAYLHDVGSWPGWAEPGKEHGDVSAAKLDRMLAGTDFPKGKMEKVREAMRTHMFYRNPVSPEARYLHDADALDNMGAIGVASLLEMVGRNGGNLTGQKAITFSKKNTEVVQNRLVTPAGKAQVAPRLAEQKALLDALDRETNGFKMM